MSQRLSPFSLTRSFWFPFVWFFWQIPSTWRSPATPGLKVPPAYNLRERSSLCRHLHWTPLQRSLIGPVWVMWLLLSPSPSPGATAAVKRMCGLLPDSSTLEAGESQCCAPKCPTAFSGVGAWEALICVIYWFLWGSYSHLADFRLPTCCPWYQKSASVQWHQV